MAVVSGEARPVPEVDALSRDFWTGGARGLLLVARCAECRRWLHPPGPICPGCSSRRVEAAPVSGRGRVESYTIVRRPWIAGYPVPYVVARVRLEEQADLLLVTNIVECEPEAVHSDMAVEVTFERREDVHVPMFRPAPETVG